MKKRKEEFIYLFHHGRLDTEHNHYDLRILEIHVSLGNVREDLERYDVEDKRVSSNVLPVQY